MAVDAEVLSLARAAMNRGINVSIFDDSGRLLWFSAGWHDEVGPMANPAEVLGLRWLEFVHPDDHPIARVWIAAGEGATVHFRCLCCTAANLWLDCMMTKRRAGAYWLAVGDNRRGT